MSTRDLSDHLRVARYGAFELTDGVRPSLDLQVVPVQGFRVGRYRDPSLGLEVPVLAASISRELLFDGLGFGYLVITDTRAAARREAGRPREAAPQGLA